MSAPVRRPPGVTLLVVLILIGGVLEILGGVVLILGHENATVLRETGRTRDFLMTGGVVAIVLGLLYLLVSRGLARGNGIARFLVGLLSLLSLAGGLWAAVTQHGTVRNQGIASAAIGLVVLVLLYSPKANTFFRTN